MSPLTVLLSGAVAIAAVAEYRRHRNALFLVVIAVALIVASVEVVLHAPKVALGFGMTEGVLLAGLTVEILDLVGLPEGVARRTRIGLRSREWEFDDRLHREKEALDELIARYPSPPTPEAYGHWRDEVLRLGPRRVARMRRLRAPDAEWGDLRDEYALMYESILGAVGRNEAADEAQIMTRGRELRDRGEHLRARYRAAARALLKQ